MKPNNLSLNTKKLENENKQTNNKIEKKQQAKDENSTRKEIAAQIQTANMMRINEE